MSRIVTAAVVALLSATVSSNASAQGLPRATPESVGLSPDRLMRVDSLFESYIADGRMAGVVVAIARRGQLAHFRTLGRMDMAQDHPMKGDAIFRLASMTKPIISVAVLQLYEEGHFQLDDPVSLYIPELSEMRPEAIADDNVDGREMTVRDLLIHTAGLPGDDEDSGHSQVWANRDMTLQQLVTEIGKQPLAYSPGTEWRYSAATNILGYLVEVLSHQPLEVFLEQRVFQPLRMVDTRFFVPSAQAASYTARPHEDLVAMSRKRCSILSYAGRQSYELGRSVAVRNSEKMVGRRPDHTGEVHRGSASAIAYHRRRNGLPIG